MASIFTIDGTPADPDADEFLPRRFTERFGGIPVLTLERRGVGLEATDPWLGKTIEWEMGGTTYLIGDIVSMTPRHTDAIGWVKSYQCLGLRNRLDWFPHTDANTGIDSTSYNLSAEAAAADPQYSTTRSGRTVGQILADVLTMVQNAQYLDAAGVGGYTGLPSAPVLPADTLADLALLTVIPPRAVWFTGEKFGAALDGFMGQYAPNHRPWIDPTTGHFRFIDLRTMTPTTFTMGIDPIAISEISRDVGDCFQRVVVLGAPIAVLVLLKLSNGDLTEQFAHSGLTNAAAKAAWTPAQYRQPGTAQDIGTCTCPTTLTVTVDPTDPSHFWSADFWDQSHQQGVIDLSSTTITNYTQFHSARIVNSPACSAGGTATLTIDSPLPHTSFDHYTISGLATGGSVVWTQYGIANTDLWARVTSQSTYPRPFATPNGEGVTLLSSAMGVVLWSGSGSAPYNTFPLAFTYNPTTGMIRFIAPTYIVANNAAPADVWVYLPINTNANTATEPPDIAGVPQYDGTSNSVEGLEKTLTVTCEEWRDPAQLSAVQDYASDLLDSVKDAVCEGAIVYHGLYAAGLTFGMSANVACDEGGVIATGWESLDLSVVGVDLEWTNEGAEQFETTLHCSNRRAHYTVEMFMAPSRTFTPIGMGEGGENFTPFGGATDLAVGRGGIAAAGDFGAFAPANLSPGFGDMGGMPTNPGDYLRSMGAPTSPADMGLPTNPGDYLRSQGLPTGMGMGQSAAPAAAAEGEDFAEPPPAPPPPPAPAAEPQSELEAFVRNEGVIE